jgi:hypothetical protein
LAVALDLATWDFMIDSGAEKSSSIIARLIFSSAGVSDLSGGIISSFSVSFYCRHPVPPIKGTDGDLGVCKKHDKLETNTGVIISKYQPMPHK